MFGVEKSGNRTANLKNVLDFSRHVSVLFFDDKAAMEYGKLRAELQQIGKPIGPNDTLIAAHARSNCSLTKDDFIYSSRWNRNISGQFILADGHRLQKFMQKNIAGMDIF